MACNKAIPIGIESYKEIIDEDYYYVDKTLLIRDLLIQRSKVTLFTRPRRFGKTLALSMLRTFFEKEIDTAGNIIDNSHYFTGTKISKNKDICEKHMGQYPVIFLSLKSAKQPDFETAYIQLQKAIIQEFKRHSYMLDDKKQILTKTEAQDYRAIIDRTASAADYATALYFLSACLKKYHGQNVIILIDEYDVPLENAYFHGFYEEMIGFIRSLFESALKTNDNLQFAVITGCLRISRESIFTGLNNMKVISVLDQSFAEYFGFTQNEVDSILKSYELESLREEVRSWYDGYLFGSTEVYNPWSLLNYISDRSVKNREFPQPYWSNTSSNSIVHKLIESADRAVKTDLECLMAGNPIEKPIHEDITYEDIYESQENLWNFLFFTGYLKCASQRFEQRTLYIQMKIPNEELLYIYEHSIHEWFQKRIQSIDFSDFYHALLNGDINTMEIFLKKQLQATISLIDAAENFYHGFLLGMLTSLQEYDISSNRESGDGRPDIILRPDDETMPAVIFELKHVKEFTKMEARAEEALQQIEEKHYDQQLLYEGYTNILKYGICFCKKSCKIKVKK